MAQGKDDIRYLTPPSVEIKKKKYCRFRKDRIKYIDYKDQEYLKKYLNEQGKIFSRSLNCTSLKFLRKVSVRVKRAGHLAMLTYVNDLKQSIRGEVMEIILKQDMPNLGHKD